jgi:hypothetical protein
MRSSVKVVLSLLGVVVLSAFAGHSHLVNTADTSAAALGHFVSIFLIPGLIGAAVGCVGACVAGGGISGLRAFWWIAVVGMASALAPVAITIWAMSRPEA